MAIFKKLSRWSLRIFSATLLLLMLAAWTISHYYFFGVGYRGKDTALALRVADQELTLWQLAYESGKIGFETFARKNSPQIRECMHDTQNDKDNLLSLTFAGDGGLTEGSEFTWFDFTFHHSLGASASGIFVPPHTHITVPFWFMAGIAALCFWTIWRFTSTTSTQPISWRKATAPLWVVRWLLIIACVITLLVWFLSHRYVFAVGHIGSPTCAASFDCYGIQCGTTYDELFPGEGGFKINFLPVDFWHFRSSTDILDAIHSDETRSFCGFQLEHDPFGSLLLIPHWFLVLTTATACYWTFRRNSLTGNNKTYGFPVTVNT